jgi:hypothetical protein
VHLLKMTGVFAVGALAGLGGAWWVMTYAPAVRSPAPQLILQRPVVTTEGLGKSRPATMVRGISASELPYDGAPTPLAERARPKPPVETEAVTLPKQDLPSSRDAVPTVAPDPAAVESNAQEISAEAPPQAPKVPDTVPTPGKAADTLRARSAPVTPPARDHEIARIKRQAEDELKQKNRRIESTSVKSRSSERVGEKQRALAATSMSKTAEMRTKLARCDQGSNFIRRELCKWHLCSGMWGKDGCPSYAKQASSY